jgi:hypothetical protein
MRELKNKPEIFIDIKHNRKLRETPIYLKGEHSKRIEVTIKPAFVTSKIPTHGWQGDSMRASRILCSTL